MNSTVEITNRIAAWTDTPSIFIESNFAARADALEEMEMALEKAAEKPDAATDPVRDRIVLLKHRLQAIDSNLFGRLRTEIKEKRIRGTAFRNLVGRYLDPDKPAVADNGYDSLDLFVNGLFSDLPVPEPILDREPGMVYYQKTPARVVFEMAELAADRPDEFFVDIGSGLGQAVMLMHLLTGMSSTGIEFEPAYCHYARVCASALGLEGANFINQNALDCDFSAGTIFFLYTPFVGAMMQQMLGALQAQSLHRPLRLFSYGPGSGVVAKERWLRLAKGIASRSDSLCVFTPVAPGQRQAFEQIR